MSRVIVIRYGEIFLKGKNRDYFESLLIKNIKAALSGINYRFTRTQGRYYAEDFAPEDESEMVERLKRCSAYTPSPLRARSRSWRKAIFPR